MRFPSEILDGINPLPEPKFYSMAKGDLTPKQARFVHEYLKDLNATQAAIRAGFSPKAAAQAGSRLLTFVKVQEAVTAAQKGEDWASKVTRHRILRELARIAFADPRRVMKWGKTVELVESTELNDDEAAQVAEVSETTTQHGGTIRLKRFDRVKALELLGRHLGMFGEDPTGAGATPTEPGEVVHFYLPENGR